jgi:hypothetical protein
MAEISSIIVWCLVWRSLLFVGAFERAFELEWLLFSPVVK